MSGSAYYTQSGFGLGLDGWIAIGPDDGSGTAYSPQTYNVAQETTDNLGILTVADNTQNPHMSILGVRMGSLHIDGPLGIDRGWADIINGICGPRNETAPNSNNITPWIGTFKPGSVFTSFSQGMMWGSRFTLDSGWAVQGMGDAATYSLDFMVLDPDNQEEIVALAPAGTSGTEGLNASSFIQMTLASASTGGVTYDGFSRFVLTFDNNLVIQPANHATLGAHRMAAGATVGQPVGTLQVFQLAGAQNVIPMSTGKHEFFITIPDELGTSTLTLAVSTQYNASSQRTNPRSNVLTSATYNLYGSNSDTAGWVLKATYNPD